jgi:hypothetical protein
MILKAGTAYPEGNEPVDAEWEYEDGGRVNIGYQGEYTLISIDPDELLAIADAIRGKIMFNQTLNHEQKRIR